MALVSKDGNNINQRVNVIDIHGQSTSKIHTGPFSTEIAMEEVVKTRTFRTLKPPSDIELRTKLEELLDEEDDDWNSIRDIICANVLRKTISLTNKWN